MNLKLIYSKKPEHRRLKFKNQKNIKKRRLNHGGAFPFHEEAYECVEKSQSQNPEFESLRQVCGDDHLRKNCRLALPGNPADDEAESRHRRL